MEVQVRAQAKTGPCTLCKEGRFYPRKLPWGSLLWPSDRLTECKTFQALSPAEKAQMIRGQGGGRVCGSWGHIKRKCNWIRQHREVRPGHECQEREGAGVCGQLHHRILHGIQTTQTSDRR